MADPNWARYAAGTGLGAAALLWVQAFVAPLYPGFDDPPLQVARYYQSNAASIRVQMLLIGVAGILFLWFLGSLRAHLRRAEGDTGRLSAVAFGAGIAVLGPASVAVISTATAAHLAGTGLAVSAMTGPREARLLAGLVAVAPLNDMRLLAYALGWFVQSTAAGRAVWHYGQWPTFSSLILKLPDRAVTLILLANSDGLSSRFPLTSGDVAVSPFAQAFIQAEGTAAEREAKAKAASADECYKRDLAAGMVKVQTERLRGLEGERSMLKSLVDWSARLRIDEREVVGGDDLDVEARGPFADLEGDAERAGRARRGEGAERLDATNTVDVDETARLAEALVRDGASTDVKRFEASVYVACRKGCWRFARATRAARIPMTALIAPPPTSAMNIRGSAGV